MLYSISVYRCLASALVVNVITKQAAVAASRSVLLSQFWALENVQGDQTFKDETFVAILRSYDIGLRPVSSRLHSKNPIETKPWVIF